MRGEEEEEEEDRECRIENREEEEKVQVLGIEDDMYPRNIFINSSWVRRKFVDQSP